MLSKKTDPAEFRQMAEHDVQWFFRLIPLLPFLKGILVFGPIVRSDGSCESLAQFVRHQATNNGFTVVPTGNLRHVQTGREFFIHEADTPGEKCIGWRLAKNL